MYVPVRAEIIGRLSIFTRGLESEFRRFSVRQAQFVLSGLFRILLSSLLYFGVF